jgi:Uma2 family endonuclease
MGTDTPEFVQTRPMTFEEYLAFEEKSPIKHELVAGYLFEYNGGEVRGLAGATRPHNGIAMNIAALLWQATRGGPCKVYGSDMRLRIDDSTTYYPDVQVVCDPTDVDPQHTSQPCLVVEVLSPSTASVDRREKLLRYQSLDSLRAYLIVWSTEQRCTLHYRDEDLSWTSSEIAGSTGEVVLACPELRLSLAEIYDGVDLPAATIRNGRARRKRSDRARRDPPAPSDSG